MRYAMGREDYEELFLLGPGETDGEERRKALEAAYPQNTAGAVLELRTRGLAASAAVLDYLIERGAIPAPGGGDGHRRKWSRADIDRAAEFLDAEECHTPVTVMRRVLNLDAAQDERARRQALAEHPEVVSADLLILEVLPGAAGVGIRATARYRPMTAGETAEWKRKVREAAARREAKS